VTAGWVSFDRAAEFYDATRGLTAEAREALADVLTAELAGRGLCLEIGVGTGRIALPVHGRGVALVGADIAPAMLARLVANAGGRRPFPLLLADATRLPLADASLGAVMASHVLHLIADWRPVVEEALRVLRPAGVLLVDFGGSARAPWSGACEERAARHGVFAVRPGVTDPGEVVRHLAGRATVRRLAPVAMTVRRSLRQDLDEWEGQVHAWMWPYSADQMRAACDDIRTWAGEQGWPLDRPVELSRIIQWWAFDRTETPGS